MLLVLAHPLANGLSYIHKELREVLLLRYTQQQIKKEFKQATKRITIVKNDESYEASTTIFGHKMPIYNRYAEDIYPPSAAKSSTIVKNSEGPDITMANAQKLARHFYLYSDTYKVFTQ